MKKNNTFNKDNIWLIFALLSIFNIALLFSLIFVIYPPIGFMDLNWNYLFSVKIAKGMIPYRDFDLLQTPLSFYITAFFLTLFGNEYLTYAVMGALFITLNFFLIYKIFHQLTHNNKVAIGFLLLTIICSLFSLRCYNYNTLSVIIITCIILREYKNRLAVTNNVLIGILFGLLFLTKQNIFFATVLLVIINILISNIDIKTKLRILLIRGVTATLIILCYLYYLWQNNALYAFIDHAFLGLSSFAEKNADLELFEKPTYIIFYGPALLILVLAVKTILKERKTDINDKALITMTYAISGLTMAYPLFDLNHIDMASLLIFPLFSFICPANRIIKYSIIIKICFILIFGNYFIRTIYDTHNKCVFVKDLNHYHYTMTEPNCIEDIKIISDYLEQQRALGNEVVILDTRAMLYWSQLDIYNNPFDLVIYGNLGYKGEERILEKIKALPSGSLFLIGDGYRGQEITELKEYVSCHYDHVGNLGILMKFNVFRKPEQIKSNYCN